MRDFVIPESFEWRTAYWRAKDVPRKINDGIGLLRRHGSGDSRVFALAFTNPFSFALRLPPPRGVPLWWDLDFSVNADKLPRPERILKDIDIVMIPILGKDSDGCCQETALRMLEAYRTHLDAHFAEIERSESWILMRRSGR